MIQSINQFPTLAPFAGDMKFATQTSPLHFWYDTKHLCWERERERERCISRKSFSLIKNCGICLILGKKSIRVTQNPFYLNDENSGHETPWKLWLVSQFKIFVDWNHLQLVENWNPISTNNVLLYLSGGWWPNVYVYTRHQKMYWINQIKKHWRLRQNPSKGFSRWTWALAPTIYKVIWAHIQR